MKCLRMSEGSDADRHDPQIKGEDNKETLLSLTTQANWGKSPLFEPLFQCLVPKLKRKFS